MLPIRSKPAIYSHIEAPAPLEQSSPLRSPFNREKIRGYLPNMRSKLDEMPAVQNFDYTFDASSQGSANGRFRFMGKGNNGNGGFNGNGVRNNNI